MNEWGISLRSRLGVLGIRVSTWLAGETRLEVNSQSRLNAALDRKSHHLLLLLLLWRSRRRKKKKVEEEKVVKEEEKQEAEKEEKQR